MNHQKKQLFCIFQSSRKRMLIQNPIETNTYNKVQNTDYNKSDLKDNLIENIIEERNNLLNSIGNKNLLLEYSELNKKKCWPVKTNINCFWDGHPFESRPFGLPIKKCGNEIHMFGNFCSPECAAAYNFNMRDSDQWERYTFLNELYSKNMTENIKLAPSKLVLKEFGGFMSIKDYRTSIYNSKEYKVCLPPIVSQIPTLEEVEYNLNGDIIPLNKNKLVNKNSDYRLKRDKPILDTNTLDNIMNLKYL